MIPTTEITGGMLDALIVYVAILGILLLIATWLRQDKFLKKSPNNPFYSQDNT